MITDFEIRWGAGRSEPIAIPPVAILPSPTFASGPPACLCPGHYHVQTFQSMGPVWASLPPSDIRNRCPLPRGGIRDAIVGTKLHCNRSEVML